MTSEQLELHYAHILSDKLKVNSTQIPSFFDLIGMRYSEQAISNMYYYYFNPAESHGWGDLFISSLCEIIFEKTGHKIIDHCTYVKVQREVYTHTGKFIDLVIAEPEELNNGWKNAIVIENKISAFLYNDLVDYFDFVKVKEDKMGVVLSIRKELPNHPSYVNITHGELMLKVEKGVESSGVSVSARQLFLTREFIQHIKSLSMTQDLSEEYNFYFRHEEKVRAISKLHEIIKADLFNQLSAACKQLDLKLGAPYNSNLRYFYSHKGLVCFTIWMPELFTQARILKIFVELDREGIQYLDNINTVDFSVEEKGLIKEKTKVRATYLHYATETFPLTEEQIRKFSDTVFQLIRGTPLYSIFKKIERIIPEAIALP